MKGYIYVKENGKLIQEHRLIAEKILKRKLNNSEKIHHVNHKKTDNNPENLMLFENQNSHKSFENKQTQFGNTRYVLEEINKRLITNLK